MLFGIQRKNKLQIILLVIYEKLYESHSFDLIWTQIKSNIRK